MRVSGARVVNERIYHREPNNGDKCWEDNDGSAESSPVTECGHRESKDSPDNCRRSAQELCIARRVAHSFHQNNGEEISKCIGRGGRTTEEDREAPIVDVAGVAPKLIGCDVIVLGV